MSGKTRKEELTYDSTAKVSTGGKAILGRISGPCADTIDATRNGRRYSEKLWEKVFSDPIIKEYFEAGGIFGELNHPTDREETDLEKVAICMPEPPVKNSKGQLIGKWDILDTPCGRIAKCLFDYGYKLGISSRGSGDTYQDYDGKESVDPETYTLQGFDLVYLPAMKAARLHPVTESLETKSLRKALNEAFESSTDEERKLMRETLENLHIAYLPEKDVDINALHENTSAANNDGAKIVSELQEALITKQNLEKEVERLRSELSVCYTKEKKLNEKATSVKTALSESMEKESRLLDTISKLHDSNKKRNDVIESQKAIIESMQAKTCDQSRRLSSYSEFISKKDAKIKSLEESIDSLKAENALLESKIAESTKMYESRINELQTESKIKLEQYQCKIDQKSELAEKYKDVAKKAVDKYIKSQAVRLGVTPDQITSRLTENYTFKDIDEVCSNLKSYKITVNSLPFDLSSNKSTRARISESRETIQRFVNHQDDVDDEIDEALANVARIN